MTSLRNSFAVLAVLTMAAGAVSAPTIGHAAQGDCAQPVSNGNSPVATDCLVILQTAVSSNDCNGLDFCVCRTTGGDNVVATDSLLCLQVATSQRPIDDLNCPTPCPPNGVGVQCSSGEFIALPGSDVDSGWNGLGHNQELIEGASITARVVKRCADEPGTICETVADCPAGPCELTCACDGGDTECEVSGPTHERRCLRNLEVCSTNADCAAPETCEHFFGPPLPLSADGTPACVTSFFASGITGTADSATGEGSISAFLRSRVHLGVGASTPCPTCGTLAQNPTIGDAFTCGGGSPNTGDGCTVDAVSPQFGGVSFDCPPESGSNVSGIGLAIIFKEAKTGSAAEQATLPCGFPLSQAHPDIGQGTCNDNFDFCDTNADCTRCVDDRSVCTSNADCSAGVECAEAPDQPIACGIYCHCGFCGGTDINQPCFSDVDCDEGVQCLPGAGGASPSPQTRHNACSNLICGDKVPEECCPGPDCTNQNEPGFGPTPQVGSCSAAEFRPCDNNAECATTGSGTCQFENNPCFGGRIERTGVPDPLDQACDDDFTTPCDTNADCSGGATCQDFSEPTSVALFCIPPTTSAAINAAAGIPGPGSIQFTGRLIVARCGDGRAQADEECDDGNLINGDGCNEDCKIEP